MSEISVSKHKVLGQWFDPEEAEVRLVIDPEFDDAEEPTFFKVQFATERETGEDGQCYDERDEKWWEDVDDGSAVNVLARRILSPRPEEGP